MIEKALSACRLDAEHLFYPVTGNASGHTLHAADPVVPSGFLALDPQTDGRPRGRQCMVSPRRLLRLHHRVYASSFREYSHPLLRVV